MSRWHNMKTVAAVTITTMPTIIAMSVVCIGKLSANQSNSDSGTVNNVTTIWQIWLKNLENEGYDKNQDSYRVQHSVILYNDLCSE